MIDIRYPRLVLYNFPSGVPSQWHNDFFSKEGDKEVVIKRLKDHFTTTYFERGKE